MQLDTLQPFENVCTSEAFQEALHDLQKLLKPRNASEIWARNLRFICPAPGYEVPSDHSDDDDDDVDNDDDDPRGDDDTVMQDDTVTEDDVCTCYRDWGFEATISQDTLIVTHPNDFPDCGHYVAVSWCWTFEGTPKSAPNAPPLYSIQEDVDGSKRPCTIPRHVISRAIAFASLYGVPFLWFDKECINQRDPNDQALGIQSMDIVYQRSLYPLGILQAYFDQQWQIDMFAELVEGCSIEAGRMPQLRDLLTIVEHDNWFTRAWILQESVSGGCEMTLLIQHDPSLSKPSVLGGISGEIEITIEELRNVMGIVQDCVARSDKLLEQELELELNMICDNVIDSIPLVGIPPDKGWGHPDYRQTCNAAEALTYLRYRHNTVVSDRIAIMGNLCDYKLRFDANELESRGYTFSLCAYALAVLNGDLSLSKSDNPRNSQAIGFSWGPQQSLIMDQLQHFEDDNDVVRASPAKLVNEGLLVKGWLWKVDVASHIYDMSESTQQDPPAAIWTVMKSLIRDKLYDVASLIWEHTRNLDLLPWHKQTESSAVPARLGDILDPETGAFIYHNEPWIKTEDDFRLLFPNMVTINNNPRTVSYSRQNQNRGWREWFWRYLTEHRRLPLAKLVSSCSISTQSTACTNTAIFLPQLTDQTTEDGRQIQQIPHDTYIFLPSTSIDHKLHRTQRRDQPIFWGVNVEHGPRSSTNHRIVRGTGQIFHGFCRPSETMEPELFVFA